MLRLLHVCLFICSVHIIYANDVGPLNLPHLALVDSCPLPAPCSINATVEEDYAILTWCAVDGAATYEVTISECGAATPVIVATTTSPTYTTTSLPPGCYEASVTACCALLRPDGTSNRAMASCSTPALTTFCIIIIETVVMKATPGSGATTKGTYSGIDNAIGFESGTNFKEYRMELLDNLGNIVDTFGFRVKKTGSGNCHFVEFKEAEPQSLSIRPPSTVVYTLGSGEKIELYLNVSGKGAVFFKSSVWKAGYKLKVFGPL